MRTENGQGRGGGSRVALTRRSSGRILLPRRQAQCTLAMDVDDVPAVLGSRPDRLLEVRPQERVLRRAVEQNVDVVTFPAHDVPMPQMVDQPLALLLSAHFPDPEQVIEVPKISLPSRPTRRFPRFLQLAEQLVEAPTIDRWFILLVQIADIPALRGPFGTSGLRSFLPGQAYSLTAEQIVDNPVPRRDCSEQTVHTPVPHGGRHDLSPSAADFSNPPDTANQGVFSTFPQYKKSAKIPRTQWCESAPGVELMASMSSAGILAYFMGNDMGAITSSGCFWQSGLGWALLLLVSPLTQWSRSSRRC